MYGPVLGMRFLPTDMEIISFLEMRVEGSPLPPALIHECDVYAQEPWNLPRDFMHGVGEEVYYFTPRHRASANGSGCRANRSAGEGFWHGNGRDQLIFNNDSTKVIGHKTSLVFKFRDSKRKRLHPNWIMHEYLLHSPDGKFQEMALCRIHPKGETSKEVEDDFPNAHDCKRRRIHASRRSMPLPDQACGAKDCSNGDGVVKVTATRTEQEIASQLVPPQGLVDDRSTGTTISSASADAGFIDSDISEWVDSMIVELPSSPILFPSGSQPMEVPVSSDGENADVLEWIEGFLQAEDDMFQEMALCRIHPKGETSKEVEDDFPAAHDCERRRIHASRSMPLPDQDCGAKDCSNGDGVVKVTSTRTRQEIASQLVPPQGLVDDRSTGTTISSASADAGFIDSDISEWVDSMIVEPPSSPMLFPSGSQPMEVPVSSDGENVSVADVLEWIESFLQAEDDMVPYSPPFATGSPSSHPTSAGVSTWAAILEAGENAIAPGLV